MNKITKSELQAFFDQNMSKREVCVQANISMSTLNRRLEKWGITPPKYVQSEETKSKRAKAIKQAHKNDPSLIKRKTNKIVTISKANKGKTMDEIYGHAKSKAIKEASSKSHKGFSMPQSTKEKIRKGNLGKTMSAESREKLSQKRKQMFKDGTLKLAPTAGFGKGGYKSDIDHYIRSSYEHFYAQHLMSKSIAYTYESEVFAVNTKTYGESTYTPDFYIISQNLYVEIKNPYNVNDPVFLEKLEAFKMKFPEKEIKVIVGNRHWVPTL